MDVLEALECLYLLTQFLASIQNKKWFVFNEIFPPMRGAEKTATGNGYGTDEFLKN